MKTTYFSGFFNIFSLSFNQRLEVNINLDSHGLIIGSPLFPAPFSLVHPSSPLFSLLLQFFDFAQTRRLFGEIGVWGSRGSLSILLLRICFGYCVGAIITTLHPILIYVPLIIWTLISLRYTCTKHQQRERYEISPFLTDLRLKHAITHHSVFLDVLAFLAQCQRSAIVSISARKWPALNSSSQSDFLFFVIVFLSSRSSALIKLKKA